MADLLLELQVSEMPADAQIQGIALLEQALEQKFGDFLWQEKESYSTPRRIALILKGIPNKIPDRIESRRGPKISADIKAIQGFANSMGVELDNLEIQGTHYHAQRRIASGDLKETLEKQIAAAIKSVKWPKSMHWNQGNFRWIRPMRRILCLLEQEGVCETLHVKVQDIPCGNHTQGHFLMHRKEIAVHHIHDYKTLLKKSKVILSREERRSSILKQIKQQASDLDIWKDEELLDEISGLVEYPVVFLLDLEEEFRSLPPEILRITASKHQRFIVLLDKSQKRNITKFAVVANIADARNSEQIKRGYARVLRSRLLDAKMLWEQDMNDGLDSLDKSDYYLGDITINIALEQIRGITLDLAEIIHSDQEEVVDLEKAAEISKADLQARSVQDFREQMRGITASYMAKHACENDRVCMILKEQYWPEQGDHEIQGPVSLILANKIHLLYAVFDMGGKPKGSNDRHGIRAKTLAVIRLLLEKRLNIFLENIIRFTDMEFSAIQKNEDTAQILLEYIVEKALNYMHQEKKIPMDILKACIIDGQPIILYRLLETALAIQKLMQDRKEEFKAFLDAVHRIEKILEPEKVDESRELPKYTLIEEKELAKAFKIADRINSMFLNNGEEEEDYEGRLLSLMGMEESIRNFFDHVHIHDQDKEARDNRLLLLRKVQLLCRRYAHFGEIQH